MAPGKTAKIERLMNLVIALLATRGYLTAERIRANVAGYGGQSDEAFSRMFERDKGELRDLGIPLETGRVSAFEPTEGYRIKPDAYALPAIDLTSEEAAAVALAITVWQSPERVTATQSALIKLRAAGVDVEPADRVAFAAEGAAGLRGSEQALGILLSAIDSGHVVRFRHRPSVVDPYTDRIVEPWGVVTARGRWYLVGHDRDRDSPRVFRLSRVDDIETVGGPGAFSRPEGVDLRTLAERSIGSAVRARQSGPARVWVADDQAIALRRAGRSVGRRAVGGRSGEVIELEVDDAEWLEREIAGYGPDALVLEPAELRAGVLKRLSAHAGASS